MEVHDDDTQPDYQSEYQTEESFVPPTTTTARSGSEPGTSPESAGEKRDIRELLKDKRFMLAFPLFLLGFGGFFYYMTPRSSGEEASTGSSTLNTGVPTAKTDSSAGGKLSLQEEDMMLDMNPADPTAGMQDGLPQEKIEPYLYGDKRRVSRQAWTRRSSDQSLRLVDSAIYGRNSSLQTSPHPAYPRPGSSRSGLPSTLVAGSGSSGHPDFLREQDVMLSPERRAAAVSPEQAYSQSLELQKTVAKQQRLMSLLEEYQADKERKRLVDEDKKVVRKPEETPLVGSLSSETVRGGGPSNTFYGLYTEDLKKQQTPELEAEVGTIRAMVFGDQDVLSNGRVRIRLLEPIMIRSVVIPAGSIIYGIGTFGTERVQIRLNSIQYENKIFPVTLMAYDMDGMTGIYVPNVTGQDESRQALAQSVNSSTINTTSGFNTNALAAMGSSAAQAAIQGARQFAQRKATQKKAHLKNNYYILLRSTSDADRGSSTDRRPVPGIPGGTGVPNPSVLPAGLQPR